MERKEKEVRSTERLLTVDEVAVKTGYTTKGVRQKANRRDWEYVRLGRNLRFRKEFIDGLIESGVVPPLPKQQPKARKYRGLVARLDKRLNQ